MLGMLPEADEARAVQDGGKLRQTLCTLTEGMQDMPISVTAKNVNGTNLQNTAHEDERMQATLAELLRVLPHPEELGALAVEEHMWQDVQDDPVVGSLWQACQAENLQYRALTKALRSDIVQIQAARDGRAALSPTLLDVRSALSLSTVPQSWSTQAFPSTVQGVAQFVTDVQQRVAQIQEWLSMSTSPEAFWLPALFKPTRLLMAVRQGNARSRGLPMDEMIVDLVPARTDRQETKTKRVFIHGARIEGAHWDNQKSILSHQTLAGASAALGYICVHVGRPEERDRRRIKMKSWYECPLYCTSLRHGDTDTMGNSSNFIGDVCLQTNPTSQSQMWLKRGVALIVDATCKV